MIYTVLYLQQNITLIAILMIMYFNISGKYFLKNTPDQLLFKTLIIILITIVFFDSGMWYIDGRTFPGARTINYIVTIVYLCLNPIVGLFWGLYGDYRVFGDLTALKSRLVLYILPSVIFIVFTIMSISTGWIFYIDEANCYHRGAYSMLTPVIAFMYFLQVVAMILKSLFAKEKKVDKEIYLYFLLFPLPLFVGTIIQMLFYGISLIWASFTISVFMIFIKMQNNKIYVDQLTGAYKRVYIEEHLAGLMRGAAEQGFFVLLLDMDRFKSINDTYGHLAGDRALNTVSDILLSASGSKYTVSRFGGDEFVVYGHCSGSAEVEALADKIRTARDLFNDSGKAEYKIEFTIGTAIYDKVSDASALLKRADNEMYRNKRLKKREPRG